MRSGFRRRTPSLASLTWVAVFINGMGRYLRRLVLQAGFPVLRVLHPEVPQPPGFTLRDGRQGRRGELFPCCLLHPRVLVFQFCSSLVEVLELLVVRALGSWRRREPTEVDGVHLLALCRCRAAAVHLCRFPRRTQVEDVAVRTTKGVRRHRLARRVEERWPLNVVEPREVQRPCCCPCDLDVEAASPSKHRSPQRLQKPAVLASADRGL